MAWEVSGGLGRGRSFPSIPEPRSKDTTTPSPPLASPALKRLVVGEVEVGGEEDDDVEEEEEEEKEAVLGG